MDNSIHVALAVYDPSGTYAQHAGVVVTSLFEHTKRSVIIHLLHDNTLTDLNRERFLKTAERYKQTINFVNVEDYKNNIDKDLIEIVGNRWTIGTLYRLFIPEILPELEKIIYLDCDIVVNLDIAELWDIDIGDNCLGGVLGNGTLTTYEKFLMKLNSNLFKEYINAGVLIMNLNKIRERGNFLKIVMEWLARHLHSAKFTDQDALNSIFSGSIKFIDSKYNYPVRDTTEPDINLRKSIVHFYTVFKPWYEIYGLSYERFYWSTLFKSAWLDTCNGGGGGHGEEEQRIERFMEILARTLQHHPRIHRRVKQCFKNILNRCFLRIYNMFKLDTLKIIPLVIQETIARIKYLFK